MLIIEEDGTIKFGETEIEPASSPAFTSEASEPRLIILDIIIKNFKSYAGEHKIGPFHKNFTSIIGPNGSGKSNVIDALLFVFGFRGQKIRAKKLNGVIHKSDANPDFNNSTVTVNFATIKDTDTGFIKLPDSEFSISRTIDLKGNIYYEISGRKVQHKEVDLLLRRYGIDMRHNRFLILQGEIELISQMKPKKQNEHEVGLLEYLDDIIGSSRFIEYINKLHAKIEELNELYKIKESNLKQIENEKKALEEPKNNAIQYLKLQNKKTTLENSLLQLKLKNANHDLIISINLKEEISQKIDAFTNELKKCDEHENIKQLELEQTYSEYEIISEDYEICKKKLDVLEREKAICDDNFIHVLDNLKILVKNLDTEELKLKQCKNFSLNLKAKGFEFQEKKKDIEISKVSEETKMNEAIKSIKQDTNNLHEEKTQSEAELRELQIIVSRTKSERDLVQSELDLYTNNFIKEEEKLNRLCVDYANAIQLYEENCKYLKDAQEQKFKLEGRLASFKNQLEVIIKTETNFSQKLSDKRIKIEETKFSLQSMNKCNAIIQEFLEQKAKGNFTGFIGRLGDLGSINEKYDIAISSSCVMLEAIVTDTLETAEACVEHLKKNNLGYKTFIPLDKMKEWEKKSKEKIFTPENVPRLYDLIHVEDKRLLPAFYFALRDTLVAENLDQATRIGLQGPKRFKVVTLKGEIVEISGAMTGGGEKIIKGRMGSSIVCTDISQVELNTLQDDFDNCLKQLNNVRELKKDLEKSISDHEKDIGLLNQTTAKTKLNCDAYKDMEKMLTLQKEKQKRKVNSSSLDEKTVEEFKNKIALADKRYSIAVENASSVEAKLKKVKDQISNITKGKFSKIKKNVNNLDAEINKISKALIKIPAAIKKADKEALKCEKNVVIFRADIDNEKESCARLRKELIQLDQRKEEIIKEIDNAMVKKQQYEQKKQSIETEMNKIYQRKIQINKEIIEHKNKLKSIESEIKEKQSAIISLETKLSALHLHQIDGETQKLNLLSHEEIEALSQNRIINEMKNIQAQLDSMNPDTKAIQIYEEKVELFNQKQSELDKILKERNQNQYYYDELRKHRFREFMVGFVKIASKLKEIYHMLTLGGDAELELVDSNDPFAGGIDFCVRPLKKSWKKISQLSGGEKTLSSLALVFTLHYYKPSPFYVMDEIDAALDYNNVSIVGFYIKQRTKNTQFIVISLRNNMFELPDSVVGIFKIKNCTHQAIVNHAHTWYEHDK